MTAARALLLLAAAAAALHAQGAVEGKVVTTTNGSGVRKATVLLRAARIAGADDAHPRDSYLTLTDSDGHFAIAGMVPGAYECVPSRTGFGAVPPDAIPGTKYYPQVIVENGKTTSGIVVRLTPLGVISGRVMDAEGDPVVRAQVMAMANSYPATGGAQPRQTRGWGQTNDRGEYRIFNLFPGTYYVSASSTGGMGFAPAMHGERLPVLITTYHPATTEADQAAPVELHGGAEAEATDIHMQRIRVFSIRGKAPPTDPAHSYSVNAQRRPADANRGMFGGGGRMRNGDWEIPGLDPGSYVVTMTRFDLNNNGRAAIRDDGTQEGQTITYAFVDIADKDVEGVECTSPGAEVSGVVKAIGEKPAKLTDLRVNLTPEGGRNYWGAVKADGAFSIAGILPDMYRITVQPVNSAYLASVKIESQELASREIDLRRGGGAALAITVSNDFADADGKVTDADGNPDPSVNVTFVPDQSKPDWRDSFKSQLSDSQGRFVFHGLVPGPYTVFAWKDAPRGAPQDANFRKPFEKQGVAVTLEPGGHQSLDLKSIVTEQH